ncbi:threonine--tRNA ligase [Candidatus Endowatersipora endosymbiont of Watersipora subatra]|uniref:threonine--tRNA ligase n=1 Tax=Candidatus Endowatersipora endosymbiont of Watersipora subatra TaxID=3077946 RepID=UPI00312C9C90
MSYAISLTFPDGSCRVFIAGITAKEIAESISQSLSKQAIAVSFNGQLNDLASPILGSGQIEIITRTDERALQLIRHGCAHVLAEAVQEIWPETKNTIGPVIDNGFYYDFERKVPFTPQDFQKIEKKMREIIQRNHAFIKNIVHRKDARSFFKKSRNSYKVEILDSIPEDEEVTLYTQGDWTDLCRGPHMPSTGHIGNSFKLMRVAGAYWRGDSRNQMLSRIYGTAWASDKEMKAYLARLEEAKKRDHRKLGHDMDLFHCQEEGPGVVFWHANGWKVFQNLVNYMRRRLEAHGYDEVNAPQILDKALWEKSGHWSWYRENMFTTQTEDDRDFVIKPMNCPGHIQIFKNKLRSYRELPIKIAEFGHVHRYEPSGALHGLMRVRGFTQDDAHVFCTPEQLESECLRINNLIITTYSDFGFGNFLVKFSTRPKKRLGSDQVWDKAETILQQVLNKLESEYNGKIRTEMNPGQGAFYGPKFEYVLRDAIGRDWQCGTIQIDFALPERFSALYIDQDSCKQQPVMIHRAICGSMERFIGILIEHYAGHFPLWMAPLQAVVVTVTSESDLYGKKVFDSLRNASLNVKTDFRNEKINYKIREHSLAKVPVIIVVGVREAEKETVSLRRLGGNDQTIMTLDEAVLSLSKETIPPDILRERENLEER